MKRAASTIAVFVGLQLLGLFQSLALLAFDDTKPADAVPKDKKPVHSVSTANLPPLNKAKSVYLDKKNHRVLLKTKVVLREGLLEMLCCPAQTKEHESILSVDAKAYIVHAALIALGVDPGTPVKFEPEFQKPKGPKVEIYLNWIDKKGVAHRDKAQSWIRHAVRRYYVAKMPKLPADVKLEKKGDLSYDAKHEELLWFGHMTKEQRDEMLAMSQDAEFKKAITRFYEESQPREMEADFVFAGSQFYKDEQTGEEFYAAEAGDLICVANFPSATIDVAARSSSTGNQNLLFEPYTERIPEIDTEVTVELIPIPEKKPAVEKAADPAPKP